MNNFFNTLQKRLVELISFGLTFLCLVVIVQFLINHKLLGWDLVGIIQNAGPSFIVFIAFVVLYLFFNKKYD